MGASLWRQYKAVDDTCEDQNVCRNCVRGSCSAVGNYSKMYIGEYGSVFGNSERGSSMRSDQPEQVVLTALVRRAANIMKEIHKRGPVACGAPWHPWHQIAGPVGQPGASQGTHRWPA